LVLWLARWYEGGGGINRRQAWRFIRRIVNGGIAAAARRTVCVRLDSAA